MRTPNNERVSSAIADTPEKTGGTHRSAHRKSCAPHESKNGPERTCILTRETRPQAELVRLAISPEGPDGLAQVLPDPLAKAPGRGAWLGVSRAGLETAMAKGTLKGALARAFKGAKLAVPDNLPELIDNGLRRVVLDRLGIENRGGAVLTGSDRIAEQARAGRVELLLHASDASEGGRSKLDQAWRVGNETEGSGARGVVMPLDRDALSVALGRTNVVHLGLTEWQAAKRVDTALQRLLRYRGSSGGDP